MSMYGDMYKSKLVSPEQAVGVVKSGDWVEWGSFACRPLVLDRALARRKEELQNVKVRAVCTVYGVPEIVKTDPTREHFCYNNWHFSVIDRKLSDKGLCSYIPQLYREAIGYLNNYCRIDVAMLQVAPMDQHGYFNFGPAVSHAYACCENAKIVILEINQNIPRALGGNSEAIHISEVDYLVEGENTPLQQVPTIPFSEEDRIIANYVMEEIEDGACIQLGIGGMPNVVGKMLAESDLKDIGVHTEMLVDAFVDMYETGALTGRKKKVDRCKIVYTFALGSQRLYDFINNNPLCAAYPVNYTNNPNIIAQNDRVVSINNAVEIDLFGQVNSETSGNRQISGTGGQVDFIEGAYNSKGGKSFICLTSTYRDKSGKNISRIKPHLSSGSIATTHRAAVQYVITEYGKAILKGKTTWQRAEALISIAHPDFRAELIQEAEKVGIWRRSNKR
ncbi:acetyl-CoA hydrolase/transferase family protein [Desulfotomaculum sp. 1211_IL3151]|uniref:acetyl-CoA hydrolase/transferase family protein n=1 Tax=Desulfotomaculum sp. 1211_IL3151 TaxID=3084055 RepID=UPI002FDA59D3